MRISSPLLCEELQEKRHRLCTDSRKILAGDVFVALPPALPGQVNRSADYIRMALEKGAFGVVASHDGVAKLGIDYDSDARYWCIVDDVREELGALAGTSFGTNTLNIPVIGITGTNGKTTCAYLLEHLYRSKGLPSGVLGTISYRWPGHDQPAPLTTPDCLTIHRSLAAMRNAGAKVAIMEISSHSIDQKRIAGIPFKAVAFTNLTQDHLDYHKTMEAYFQAKRSIFCDFPLKDKIMVVNADDGYGQRLLEEFPQAFGVGIQHPISNRPCLFAKVLKADTSGLDLHFFWQKSKNERMDWPIHSPLVGLHNASNLLLVSGLALNLGFTPEDFSCFSGFMGVPGRLERISTPFGADTGVFVDYAHTPDALARVLEALRQAKFQRIITVFGCGGDRDRSKRSRMGEAVASRSDIVIVTSDNPRTENPDTIINDIMPGLSQAKELYREANRRKALELAVRLLRPSDALLVAGKGHEDYQIIGTEKHHFSDQEILKELLPC